MLPTLNLTGDVVLAEHVSTRLGKVGPGDVVVVRSPENPNKYVTKRIVGMEGDRVTFSVDPISSDGSKTLVVCILFCFVFFSFSRIAHLGFCFLCEFICLCSYFLVGLLTMLFTQ